MPFRNLTTSGCLFALVLVLSVVPLNAQTPLRTEIVVSGLTRPVFATSPVGDFNRLFVVEQRGSASTSNRADIRIMDINTRTMYTKPFLSISPVRTSSEEGLLGLAFHPNYAGNGYFFTYHTNTSGDNVVTRWQVSGTNPDSANPASASILMTIPHPLESNHNGGWMAFGPDGFLYISAGDGGGSNDEHNNGQNLNTLLGSMLRIDVDSGTPYGIPPSNPFFGGPQREEIYYWDCAMPGGIALIVFPVIYTLATLVRDSMKKSISDRLPIPAISTSVGPFVKELIATSHPSIATLRALRPTQFMSIHTVLVVQ